MFLGILLHPWGYLAWITVTLAPGKMGQPMGDSEEPHLLPSMLSPEGFRPVLITALALCVAVLLPFTVPGPWPTLLST